MAFLGGGVRPHPITLILPMANERARNLRKRMSDGERKLWHAMRAKQIDGLRFRRQHPIGAYIVDFVCFEKRLIVGITLRKRRSRTINDGIAGSQPKDIELSACQTWRYSAISVVWSTPSARSCWRCRRCAPRDTPTRRAE